MNAVFLHCPQTTSRNFNVYSFIYFWHKNSLLLKIRIFSDFTGRVEFSGAGAVAVAAADLGTFFGDSADFGHKLIHHTGKHRSVFNSF